jgi:hypothetical protein
VLEKKGTVREWGAHLIDACGTHPRSRSMAAARTVVNALLVLCLLFSVANAFYGSAASEGSCGGGGGGGGGYGGGGGGGSCGSGVDGDADAAADPAKAMDPVNVLFMVSGKSYSGKHFVTSRFVALVGASPAEWNVTARRFAFKDQGRIACARNLGLEEDRIVNDWEYREEHDDAVQNCLSEKKKDPVAFKRDAPLQVCMCCARLLFVCLR